MIEKPKLTKRQRNLVELVGGWIARDRNGDLCAYTKEPNKLGWAWSNEDKFISLSEILYFTHLDLPFITWEDDEPWSVEELRKLEVIEE